MSTELLYLFLTAVLLSVLWIPQVICQVNFKGLLTPEEYRDLRDLSGAPKVLLRANRAHVNLVEQFGSFAAFIVIAHLLEVSTAATTGAAMVFFWARIIHAIAMLTGAGIMRIRTLIFTVSVAAQLVIAWEIAAAKLF
jgi:uncharacterized MAPEG superfamily protein